jgi:2-C-methyl-D-erythritol 4-phosphate cytidylyltransferase
MTAGLWCVVPAAGRGLRVGGEQPKQYLPLAGRALIAHTLERLARHPDIAGLMVALAPGDPHWSGAVPGGDVAAPSPDPASAPVRRLLGKPLHTVTGGAERADSVLAALNALPDSVVGEAFVLVHDAARPCVRAADITRLIERGCAAGGALLGAPLRDTLKRADAASHSLGTEAREARWRAFTPQLFRRGELTRALADALAAGLAVTDEAMAMERAGFAPLLVEGAEDNIKVTTPADLALAEFLLERTI